MFFFIASFLLCVLAIIFTWSTNSKVGIIDLLPVFHLTAGEKLATQGLSTFAFAFFLHAVLQSQTFQALFISQKKWLKKNKFLTIALITGLTALLTTNFSWFDEFVHFYPLIMPFLSAMGFDYFSSFLCLYGGSIAGLIGVISPERMNAYFTQCFGSIKGFNFSATSGMEFRIITFFIFTTITILFNTWYCSRNSRVPAISENDLLLLTPPAFTKKRKIILGVASFFLLGSFLGQVTPLPVINSNKGSWFSYWTSEYKKKEYVELGKINTIIKKGSGKRKIAKVEEISESYWGEFGKWEQRAIDCWFISGAIIICWLAKLKVGDVLLDATKSSLPLIFVYILAAVPTQILKNSGITNNLAKAILSEEIAGWAQRKYVASLLVFAVSLLLSFFTNSTSLITTFISTFATTLLANTTESIFLHLTLFAWMGSIIGMACSPNNGILLVSLEQSKTTYKEFTQKTWPLGLIMLITSLTLTLLWV